MKHHELSVSVSGQGLYDLTEDVRALVVAANCEDALVNLFIRHTSASLLIQENADPAVGRDLQAWLDRLVPENDGLYSHVEEGPDDMPGHIKSALTAVSLSIPVVDGAMALGTWQGIYLWEHRHAVLSRSVLVSILV